MLKRLFVIAALIAGDVQMAFLPQATGQAAIQGGMDWDTGAGFHFGFWGSKPLDFI